jgi:hypothetical protein
MADKEETARKDQRGRHLSDYLPLIVIIALSALTAAALMHAHPPAGVHAWMTYFMGFFLVIFSMFKFFDLEGFADGFQMYDLAAKRVRAYAYVYPFLELGLGLGYLSGFYPALIYSGTILLMSFGAASVLIALKKGLNVNCACMGSVLKVPLSTVALTENLGMTAMGLFMLLNL